MAGWEPVDLSLRTRNRSGHDVLGHLIEARNEFPQASDSLHGGLHPGSRAGIWRRQADVKRQTKLHVLLEATFEIHRRGGTCYALAGCAELGAEFCDLDLCTGSGHRRHLFSEVIGISDNLLDLLNYSSRSEPNASTVLAEAVTPAVKGR